MENQKFTFMSLPKNVEELKALPEADLTSPFKTVALALVALLQYENDAQATIDMLNVLYGPEPMTPYAKQFLRDRLSGKQYKVSSFFEGSSPENNYSPNEPYTIEVTANPYSFTEENYATMYVKSSGADSARSLKLRKKPSTGQWFLLEIQCLSDIRIPAAADPWA